MNTAYQKNCGRTDAKQGASGKHSQRNFLRLAWVLALCMSIAGWVTVVLFLEKTSWIDIDGFLHEPLFWLIPTSYLFLFVAIVLAISDMALKLKKHHCSR